MTTATFYKKIEALERQVQELKVSALLSLPRPKVERSVYKSDDVMRALKKTRAQIWRRYAK